MDSFAELTFWVGVMGGLIAIHDAFEKRWSALVRIAKLIWGLRYYIIKLLLIAASIAAFAA